MTNRVKSMSCFLLCCVILSFALCSNVLGQTVSEEARRHMARGEAAVEMAKSAEDYTKAIQEFEKAARLAPEWPDVYFNLGMVQEKAERYRDAMKSLQQYLRLAPNAPDAETVKSHIIKLEYKKEQSEEEAAILGSLVGKWLGGPGRSWAMYLIIGEEGGKLYLTYETTHILNTNRESFNWHKVPVTRKGRHIRFNLQFRYYDRSSRKYVGDTVYADYNLELINSGILKGTRGTGEAYFMKDNDGSLWRMDDDSLRRLLYKRQ